MPDKITAEPNPDDFKDQADKSEAAGIADEGAAYTNAIEKDGAGETEAHPS